MSLDPEIRKKLGGFVIFPEAVTVFRRTEMSFATIFSGKNYDIKSPPLGYQKAAFNTEDSFLFWLKKKAGYRTSAVMHPVFNFKSKGFDSVAFHKEVLQLDYAAVNLVFRKLSFFSNYPALVAEKIIGRDDFEQMNNQNLLPVFAPVESYQSAVNIMAEEKYLPSNNKYLFVHLLLPHFPYVLRADCRLKRKKREPKTIAATAPHMPLIL